jgi:hypothetical protein
MNRNPDTIIRMPAVAARVVLGDPGFRYLGCAARLRGDWVERIPDRALFFEIHDAHPDDARQFMEFANRVAGHLLPPAEGEQGDR